jgi:hypothetical protein
LADYVAGMSEQTENNFTNIDNLMAAPMKARAELPLLKNNSINGQFNHRFISLGALLKEVTPVLDKNGLQLIHFPIVNTWLTVVMTPTPSWTATSSKISRR